jgi:hypothetical protein
MKSFERIQIFEDEKPEWKIMGFCWESFWNSRFVLNCDA